jgi:hypothetical protein
VKRAKEAGYLGKYKGAMSIEKVLKLKIFGCTCST